MRIRDQKKYFEQLKRYEKKFDSKESSDYKMMLKRHKDDEELDKLSFERLKELFTKYHLNRDKKNYDDIFKKPSDNEQS